MSHHERDNFVSLISTILVSIPYLAYVLSRYQAENFTTAEELKFWASAVLLMIPIRIITHIVIYILFSIGRAIVTGDQKEPAMITDERDQLIELKTQRYSMYIFMLGFIAGLVSLASGSTVAVFFGIMLLSGFVGELVTIISKYYQYKKGY